MRLVTKPKNYLMSFSNISNLILHSVLRTKQEQLVKPSHKSCIYFGIYRKAERRISLEKSKQSKSKPDFETAGA